ncbi:imidazolonepropionase [bacterium]|nr:imidazolonepropionase [bacterium]
MDLILSKIGELALPQNKIWEIKRTKNASLFVKNGKVIALGTNEQALEQVKNALPNSWENFLTNTKKIDCSGKTVTPGLVDPHTHSVFGATRQHEFKMRCEGKTYTEIAQNGGGIRYSVRKLRSLSEEELVNFTLPFLDKFFELGTTTVEVKSGYGLTLNDEIKMLKTIQTLQKLHKLTLIPTFLGAHEIPDEFRENREGYVDLLTKEMIPKVADEKLAEFCDIFTETGVYTVEESEKILTVAKNYGLKIKMHVEELSHVGGAELAGKLGAVSADHLEFVSQSGIEAMKKSGTVPVLLPGTALFLGIKHLPPARKMIDEGLPVALGTDFNPGSSMTQSLPLMMTLACTQMKMLPEESFYATTVNASKSLAREKPGILEIGSDADFVVWDSPDLDFIVYYFGGNLVNKTFKNGELVYEK